ncbi:hypothetical protein INS49_001291 [Diaporthe citri]|uniref:uncharacterized protein n=1 Tax=Diaporthe citri TaxID=83186 RepID=UPI001C817978|nr:uncharacterized protein INS49_001291 [Diaporthe citri]KAG6367109.1 hypothetical protein INS49_001291 [Diaporthe citri]
MAQPASLIHEPPGTGTIKPMQILSLGMTRTGSSSIAQALTILGYNNIHHGVKDVGNASDWPVLSRAADSFFPSLPTYTGAPFTRADWDQVFGKYEGATDIASFFALPLMEAYPEAKVILVERDVDSWYASMEEAIWSTTWGWRAFLIMDVIGRLKGLQGGLTIRKIMLGYYEAASVGGIRRKARERYHRHYAEVRAAAPEGRLLEYKVEDGWGPLCEFLGKSVPEVPFPHANKRKDHVARVAARQNMFLKMVALGMLKKLLPGVVLTVAAGLGYWAGRDKGYDLSAIVIWWKKWSSRL